MFTELIAIKMRTFFYLYLSIQDILRCIQTHAQYIIRTLYIMIDYEKSPQTS